MSHMGQSLPIPHCRTTSAFHPIATEKAEIADVGLVATTDVRQGAQPPVLSAHVGECCIRHRDEM
jgi:hypothetical protein